MKRLSIIILACTVLLMLIAFKPADNYIGRYLFWNKPDVYDLTKFPKKIVMTSPLPLLIPHGKSISNLNEVLFNISGTQISFNEINAKSKTRAFLIYKNDSIVFEKYYLGNDRISNFKSFSVAKSLLSILIGIAIDEGKIKNIHQTVGEYNLGIEDKKVNSLTIENLLLQNTQIAYNESYAPWADEPRWYYSLHVRALTKKVKVNYHKSKKYENVEYNNFILAMILEKATNRSISNYLQEKLWKPAGMEKNACYSLDSKTTQFAKVADGFNATAVDFLKIGIMMLNKGKLDNKSIVSENWVNQSTGFYNSIGSDKKDVNYKYHWWTKSNGDFFANGHFGQYIYISPSTKTVIVRLGEDSCNLAWYDDVFPLISMF